MKELRNIKIDKEFYQVSILIINKMMGNWPFDIYIKRAESTYTKLFLKDDVIDRERILGYKDDKGVEEMFVHKDDYRKYTMYVEDVAKNLMKQRDLKKISNDDFSEMVKEVADLAMVEIFIQHNIDHDSVEHATLALKGCVDLLKNDPKAMNKIIKSLTWHPYQLKHSLTVGIFSVILARMSGITKEQTIMNVAMGGFLHDVGMVLLSFDAEEKTDFTAAEFKEMRTHPQISKRILESIKGMPWEVRIIAFQHHEQINGLGYPNGLHDKEIHFLSKIVSIADGFSALTSQRPYRETPYSSQDALQIMADDRGHYDTDLLARFRSIFMKTSEDQAA